MFWLIETKESIAFLKEYCSGDGFVDVIVQNDSVHSVMNSCVALYIKRVDSDDSGFMLPLNHNDCLNVTHINPNELLSGFSSIYVENKKKSLDYIQLPQVVDLNFISILSKNKPLKDLHHSRIFSRFKDTGNHILPIAKLFQRSHEKFQSYKSFMTGEFPSGLRFYNSQMTNTFWMMDKQPIGVDLDRFVKHYKVANPGKNMYKEGLVFSQYNLYNITSRPTNKFNGVNFTAIPHDPNIREMYIPVNDYLLELDFDGYHVRLIADLIGYQFSSDSVHNQLGWYYFGTNDLTEEQYKKSKTITFKNLYGSIDSKYKNIPFFKQMNQFIDQVWEEYNNGGVICKVSGREFKNMPDMNRTKVFNYYIQNYETSMNTLILRELLRYLNDKKSSISLYTYDSVVFDIKDDEIDLEKLVQIMSMNNKFPIKHKLGTNLNFNNN